MDTSRQVAEPRRRRPRGGGTQRERRPGVWEVRVPTGEFVGGRARQRSFTVRGTAANAQALRARLVAQPDVPAPAVITVAQLLRVWVAADHPWKPSTLVGCRSVARALGRDLIAAERVAALSPRLLRETMGRWRADGVGAAVVGGRFRVLRAALGWGWGERLIDAHPIRAMRGPARPEPRRPLADDQVRALLQAAEALLLEAVANDAGAAASARRARRAEQALLLVRLAADTGARRGELAGLRVGDLSGRVLTISRAFSAGVLTTPKSGRPRNLTVGASTAALWRDLVGQWSAREGRPVGPWLFSADAEHRVPAAATVLVGGQPCTILPISRVTHVVPDGSMTPSSARDAATVTWFDDNGVEIPQPTPAPGWTPLTATAAQLAFFGLPPRPSDPTQLADWTASWANYAGFETPKQECISSFHTEPPTASPSRAQSSSATSVSAPNCGTLTCSPNWAGLVDINGSSYTEAYARTTIRSESNSCSPSDAHSDWVGLGGWIGSSQLLQNGIASAGNVNGYFAWWEAIDGNHDTNQVPVTMSLSPGNVVSMSTTYNPWFQTVTFSRHNQTTGKLATVGPISRIAFKDASDIYTVGFYDGSTAEAIDERTAVGGQYDKLRNYGTQSWDQARVYSSGSTPYSGMRTVPHVGPTMTNVAQTQTLATVTGDTTEAFHTTWQQCGTVESP